MGIGAAFPSNAFPSNAFPDNAFPAWGAVVPFVGVLYMLFTASAPGASFTGSAPGMTVTASAPTLSITAQGDD